MPWSQRCAQLQESLREKGLAGLLCSNRANIAYLTGFRGDAGWLIVGGQEIVLFTDGRFETQASEEVKVGEIEVVAEDLLGAASDFVKERPLAPLGFEGDSLVYSQYRKLTERLGDENLKPANGLVERLRLSKDPNELSAIESALRATEGALERVITQLEIGVTEAEVAAELDHTLRRLGAEKPAFETIVAFGERAALPHARPTERPLEPGDVVLCDMGASVGGYCADLTRTFFVGEPIAPAAAAYQAVLAAQEAGLACLRPGAACSEAHFAAHAALEREGLGEAFKHSLGHGVGIEVHEGPRLSRKSTEQFTAGNVVTVEPGVYIEGQFGIRIEDLAVVTDQGPRNFTRFPKRLEEMVLAP